MGIEQKILVKGASLGLCMGFALCLVVLLTACGQKGGLFLPGDPDFQQRAKLPDIVRRQLPGASPGPTLPAGSVAPPETAASAATTGR